MIAGTTTIKSDKGIISKYITKVVLVVFRMLTIDTDTIYKSPVTVVTIEKNRYRSTVTKL
jgi:hypothetical protein